MKKLSFLLCLQLLLPAPFLRAGEEVFNIDPVHSTVLLKVRHFGLADVYGRFNDLSGQVRHDEENPAATTISFEVQAASTDTNHTERDKHLRGPDFLNATEFPVITLKSTKVKREEDNEFRVTGDSNVRDRAKGMPGERRFGGGVKK